MRETARQLVTVAACMIAIICAIVALEMKIQRDRYYDFMANGIRDSQKNGVWQRDDVTSAQPPGVEYWNFTPDEKK